MQKVVVVEFKGGVRTSYLLWGDADYARFVQHGTALPTLLAEGWTVVSHAAMPGSDRLYFVIESKQVRG